MNTKAQMKDLKTISKFESGANFQAKKPSLGAMAGWEGKIKVELQFSDIYAISIVTWTLSHLKINYMELQIIW